MVFGSQQTPVERQSGVQEWQQWSGEPEERRAGQQLEDLGLDSSFLWASSHYLIEWEIV